MTTNDRLRHYEQRWGSVGQQASWSRGPVHELPEGFGVHAFAPREGRRWWTYATVGLSEAGPPHLELHLHAREENDRHSETLTMVAHYHVTGARLGLGHTVNLGRPWLGESACTHLLLSRPYLDGPALEWEGEPERGPRYLWLIPVTLSEVDFKKDHGLDALEQRFEDARFQYLDPDRASVA